MAKRITTVLPPPCDLGAPAKFKAWRTEQVDALLRYTDSDKRFVCYNVPTGGGKTLLGHMAGRLTDARTLILTSTKALQDQVRKDRLADQDVRGQRNYECVAVQGNGPLSDYGSRYPTSVDHGPCHVGVHCWMRFNGCTYYDAVRAARDSQIVVTNYSYWLSLGKSVRDGRNDEQLGEFGLIVADEAHNAVQEVCGALRVELPKAELHGMLNVETLPAGAPLDDWRLWADDALVRWGDEMDRAALTLKGQYIDGGVVAEYKELQQLGAGLEQVAGLSGDWVVGESWRGTHVTFDPVWPTSYSEELLFRQTPRVMFLSATVTPKTLDVLGVPQPHRDYVEYPSSFPLRNRPVYIVTSAPRVDFRMDADAEHEWMVLIDNFIGPRLEAGRKGIIHCVSYARMERIKRLSRYREFFITNSDSTKTQEALERYRAAEVAALLSPSVTTGEDFPDDECRWLLVPKLPFVDSRDPVMRRREQADPGYGGYMMMTTLAQSCGRGVRHQADWCEGVILDGHAKWALGKFKEHAPRYFRESWQWVNALPRMMEAE